MKTTLSISGKGGTGKTIVACLLAQELSTIGKTGLADADLDSSNIGKIMGVNMDKISLTDDRKIVPIEFNGLKINSISAMMSDSSISHSGNQYRRMVHDILINTAWDDTEYLVIDMPPSVSDIFRETIEITKQNKSLMGAVVVEQSHEVQDAKRVYDICSRLHIPIIGFIENMAGSTMHGQPVKCSCGCNEEFIPFGINGVKDFAKSVNGEFIGRIPLSTELGLKRPPIIESGAGKNTITALAQRIAISPLPKIPRDTYREAAGTPKFVGRVLHIFLKLVIGVNVEVDIASLKAQYGRKKNPGFIEVTITDCPESLSEYQVFYIGIHDGELKRYKKMDLPRGINIIGSMKLGSGPLDCILKGSMPVMDPFTLQQYTEPYSFTRAVNSGDIEIEGDNIFIEFLLADNLFAHATEVFGKSEETLRERAVQ